MVRLYEISDEDVSVAWGWKIDLDEESSKNKTNTSLFTAEAVKSSKHLPLYSYDFWLQSPSKIDRFLVIKLPLKEL